MKKSPGKKSEIRAMLVIFFCLIILFCVIKLGAFLVARSGMPPRSETVSEQSIKQTSAEEAEKLGADRKTVEIFSEVKPSQ